MRQCDVCGRHNVPLVNIFTAVGSVLICRHGHFEGLTQDAYTGAWCNLSGDKPLDALVWFPEGYIPSFRHLLLDMQPPIWEGARCLTNC